jgi:hypothetical protein
LKTLYRGINVVAKSQSLRQLLQATADGYLQAKFNFLPLWSDIVGIHSAISKSLKRLGVQVNSGGRPLTSHFNVKLKEFDQPDDDIIDSDWLFNYLKGWYGGFPNSQVSFRRSIVYSETSFHAQVQYNANYSAFQLAHAQGLTLLDQLGVNLNPQIIWNAIPWSFVVDWIANVGEYLSRFTLENMEPTINIMQYLWSVRRERKISVEATFDGVLGTEAPYPPNAGYLVHKYPAIVEVAYSRQVGLPDASSFLTSGLNLNEFSLAAALAITRKPKVRTPAGKPRGLPRSQMHVNKHT